MALGVRHRHGAAASWPTSWVAHRRRWGGSGSNRRRPDYESGDYKLRVVREGSRDKLMPISEQTIVNKPGRQDMGNHRIVYLWGSTRNGSLNVMVQDIPLGLR